MRRSHRFPRSPRFIVLTTVVLTSLALAGGGTALASTLSQAVSAGREGPGDDPSEDRGSPRTSEAAEPSASDSTPADNRRGGRDGARRAEREDSDGETSPGRDRRAGQRSVDADRRRDPARDVDNDRDSNRDKNRDNDRDKNDRDKNDRDKGRDKNNNRDRDNDRNKKDRDDDEFPGRDKARPASDDDFVDIQDVPRDRELAASVFNRTDGLADAGRASTGTFRIRCGTGGGHRNSDNFMVTPGKRNGAQHVHEYVGNLSTDAFSTDESLHAAGTTCDNNNKSTLFWPVVRDTSKQGDDRDRDGGGLDGNFGEILSERTVDIQLVGNRHERVKPMPDDLQMVMGDAKAVTNGDKNARAQWTCTGATDQITDRYPLCPAGSRLERILEFPSCWDGENLESDDQRSHTAFPDRDGRCDNDFTPIPKLLITLTYDRPAGRDFALDTFPDQRHNPGTDHADFMNIVSDELMNRAATCINSGRTC